MCRVELSTPDEASYTTAMHQVVASFVWLGPSFITPADEEGGDHTLVAFFGREGTPLPDG